jgi:hypothetical protein
MRTRRKAGHIGSPRDKVCDLCCNSHRAHAPPVYRRGDADLDQVQPPEKDDEGNVDKAGVACCAEAMGMLPPGAARVISRKRKRRSVSFTCSHREVVVGVVWCCCCYYCASEMSAAYSIRGT